MSRQSDHRSASPHTHFARRRQSILLVREEAERRAGHLDAAERADILLEVQAEVDARAMFRVDAHRAARLTPGSLDDASLSTDTLRAALLALRGLPTP